MSLCFTLRLVLKMFVFYFSLTFTPHLYNLLPTYTASDNERYAIRSYKFILCAGFQKIFQYKFSQLKRQKYNYAFENTIDEMLHIFFSDKIGFVLALDINICTFNTCFFMPRVTY